MSLTLLQALVDIPSSTDNTLGVNRVQKLVQDELNRLGFSCTSIKNPQTSSGDLLVAHLEKKSKRTITLVIHADTVSEFDSNFYDKKIAGSGVIDDKGGIVVALKGLELFLSEKQPDFSLQVLSSPNEEKGSPGFHEAFKKISLESDLILGFEPALDDGNIIDTRRGGKWYSIRTEGREAHAGREYKFGINAAHELVAKLNEIQKLTDYKNDVTVSIGALQAGKDKFNIVCGEALAKIDVRFGNEKSGQRLHKKILSILDRSFVQSKSDKKKAKTSYTLEDDCPVFEKNSTSEPYIKKYCEVIRSIEDRKIKSVTGGGSSDCNYLSRPGLAILDGLGPFGGGMHTHHEWLNPKSLETRSRALAEFLKCL